MLDMAVINVVCGVLIYLFRLLKFEEMIVNRSFRFSFPVYNKSYSRSKYEWIKPDGYDTGIKIHNPLVKKTVPLIFPDKDVVKWYICGPTVYDSTHIGHASCYIRFDIIRRALEEYFNIKPIIALGVTDVAKSIYKRAAELKMEPLRLVQIYESEFFSHMKTLNVLPPNFKLKVSHNLPHIKNFIEVLKEKGLAFTRGDDVLFKIFRDKNYGRFQSPEARKDIFDLEFSLWRNNYPGWHVECSAMASHIFGSSIDIHSGGADLTFPHHENEEALSTCYHGCHQWVNYWIHSGLVTVGDKKMSKSLGNLISVNDFLEDHMGDHLRLFIMLNSYRSNLVYQKDKLFQISQLYERIIKFIQISDLYMQGHWKMGDIQEAELMKEMVNAKLNVVESLKQDFGTAEAIKGVLGLIRTASRMFAGESPVVTSSSITAVASVNAFVKDFFKSFGFSFAEQKTENNSVVESIIDAAVNFRSKIRLNALNSPHAKSQLKFCDTFRKNLNEVGITLYDFETGAQWTHAGAQKDYKLLLHDIIDKLVGFRGSIMDSLYFCEQSVGSTLEAECEALKMNLATMGIVLKDQKNIHNWSFSLPDISSEAKFNMLVTSSLKFYNRIRELAESMDKKGIEETKEEILGVVESALSEMKSYGIRAQKDGAKDWNETNERNIKGELLLQDVIDILIHIFDSITLIIFVSDEVQAAAFTQINSALKRTLKFEGFILEKEQLLQLPTWKVSRNVEAKNLFLTVTNETVSYIYKLKASVKNEKKLSLKNAVMSLHDSAIKDLEEIGIVVYKRSGKYSWRYKVFERMPVPDENLESLCNNS